jgi:hypothetical protein
MIDRDDSVPAGLRDALAALPRELEPPGSLEGRVVRGLLASEAIGPRAVVTPIARGSGHRTWMWATAAVVVLTIGLSWWGRQRPAPPHGNAYVMLLYQDSTYVAPASGKWGSRVAEYAHWADSLESHGRLERAAQLAGAGPLTGMFIIRATSDAEAARIAASCPHLKYNGHIDTRRMIE